MPGGSHRQELRLGSSRGALACAAGLGASAGAAAERAVLLWVQLLCWRLYKMCIGIRDSLRLVTVLCQLSSHLVCQMCPSEGQNRCVLWHSSSLAPLVWLGWVCGCTEV